VPGALDAASTASAVGSAPSAPPTELSVETSHVYLLSPGKDAVRIVVSR
jgi:hypothetical protein